MHEFSPVETLVSEILKKEPTKKVKGIRLRVGGTMLPEAVRQAFAACATGTSLANARLELEERLAPVRCGCGHLTTVNVTEQDGYPFICPKCGDLIDVSPGPALEVLEISYEPQLKAAS